MTEQKMPTVDEVFSWMRKLYDESYSGLTKTEKNEQHMYGTMVTTPNDKKFMVRMLDEKGIGRPSTYAPTITTIIARGYVTRENKLLYSTEL